MSSRKAERMKTLTKALQERGVLHLKDAADMLGVSMMTIRRDIADTGGRFAYLGGHIILSPATEVDQPYELARAADSHRAAKREACAHAARTIVADDTIFVDCGTTLSHLVDFIPQDMPITAICYALNIADRLSRKSNVRLIMLGGLYYPSSSSFAGSPGFEALDQLGLNKAFISAAGIDAVRGATCEHFHEAPIKRQAISRSQESYLVVDSSKVGRVKAAFFAEVAAFRAVITEAGAISIADPG
jgi:DeoR family transcriptional regulator, deoxyribose operon repressor